MAEPPDPEAGDGAAAEQAKAPWHFKLLLVLVVLYLAWRLVQMAGWVVDWVAG
ncbi:MAG TPA: hypothetical protein VFI47_27260 [Acidimicrobiales bacterium]|nr:hypothetical protein [Acidimicrobiales bacterium]